MISRKSVLVLSMCLAAASGVAHAQWKVVAPNALVPASRFGAMYFKDGVLWAGWSTLLRSTDSGATWTTIHFPDKLITDICFATKTSGIITTTSGAFLTQDEGQSWAALPPLLDLASRVAFGRSTEEVYALTWGASVLFRSLDGAMNWQALPTNTSQEMTFTIANNGTLFLVSGVSHAGTISLSSDSGATWHQTDTTVGKDCWTIAADQGDADRLYLTEEHPGGSAPVHLYATMDGGNTWAVGYTDVDVAGSLSLANCTAFAGTEASGVLRSTDFGASWQKIGGPNGVNDNRTLCAINANIVFALDSLGTIWGTYNGGSDSVAQPINGTLSISPPAFLDTTTCSDSVRGTLLVLHDGCFPPTIEKYSIAGTDSSSYRVTGTDFDSLNILFHPSHSGTSPAILLLTLDDSATDTIPLQGWNAVEPDAFSSTPNELFSDDSLSCDSATDAVAICAATGCVPPRILQYTIAGADSACYRLARTSNDSVDVLFSPDHTGEHHAQLLLGLSNGTTDSILLGGSGLIDLPLRMTTSDEATSTVGGDVAVPITVSGLVRPEDLELTMHYQGDVRYNGSFDGNGFALDMPGASRPGRARLAIKHVVPGSIAGYSDFSVFADSSEKPTIRFDSISVVSAAPCEYAEASAISSSITPATGCGTPLLSQLLEGKTPVFRVRPNPTTGIVSVESFSSIDNAAVQVFDALGVEQENTTISFKNGYSTPLCLQLNPGIYYLRIKTGSGTFSTKLILIR